MTQDPYTAPDFERIALVTIDVQRDTLDGQPFEIPGTTAMLPALRPLVKNFRRHTLPIVHVVRLYKPDGSNADLCRRRQFEDGDVPLASGTQGSEVAPGVLPHGTRLDPSLLLSGGIQEVGPQEAILYKPRWGAFYGTSLHEHLQRMDVTTLAFAGCNFPNCPRTSIYEASERDYRIIAIEDAISQLDRRGIKELRGIGVDVMEAARLLAALSAGSPGSAVTE